MKWLIEHYLEDDILLKQAADSLGLDATLKVIPYIDSSKWTGYGLLKCSIQLAKEIEKNTHNLIAFDAFRFQVYAAYWQKWLFNGEYTMLPAGGLVERWSEFQKRFDNDKIFVRPDANDKSFNGGAYDLDGFKTVMGSPEELVVVAPAYKVEREWRCYMRNGRLIDSSLYKVNDVVKGNVKNDWTPKDYAESIPRYPGLPPVYALDICQAAGEYFILEVGSANLAALYDCDPVKIFSAIAAETEALVNAQTRDPIPG